MKEISREYLKIYRSVIIQQWFIAVICAVLFAVFGAFKSMFAVVVCICFALIALTATVVILLSPKLFEQRLNKCPEDVKVRCFGRKAFLRKPFAVLLKTENKSREI